MTQITIRIPEHETELLKKRSGEKTTQGAFNWLIENERLLRSKVANMRLSKTLKRPGVRKIPN